MSRFLMPVLLVGAFLGSMFQSVHTASAAAPGVVASRWVIVDALTGTIMAGQDVDGVQPMASLTKVMTAVVALERSDLDMTVTIVEGDLVGESSAGLVAGEVLTLRTLMHGLLLKSGNDAAMAVARAVGGSPHAEDQAARDRFVSLMNAKAAELGLSSSSFQNPHGLDDPGHYSTALDLAHLTQAALRVPGFVEIFGASSYEGEGYSYVHGNQLPGMMSGVVGGKTGWTDGCGLCLIEVAEQHGRPVIVVLLGSDWSWYEDAFTLFQFALTLDLPALDASTASNVFASLWARTDQPVEDGAVNRTWLWGPGLGSAKTIKLATSPTGWRYERLFEKGLMEINDPYARMDTGWYVTPGLLASAMLAARVPIPIAGDLDSPGVDYAMLADAARSASLADGAAIIMRLSDEGVVAADETLASYGIRAGSHAVDTGHFVADVFDTFAAQSGLVLDGGLLVEARLFDPPLMAIGLPVTDPLWLRVKVDSVPRDVLVQCFERRCLTFTPSNPAGWEVEMTNIGRHYALWLDSRSVAVSDLGMRERHRVFTVESVQTARYALAGQ